MTSYAAKSSYEFTESPKNSPQKATKPNTPIPAEKSKSIGSFLSMKWGSFTAKASEVASKARGALNDIVTSSNNGTLEGSDANLDLAYAPWENLCPYDANTESELRQLILDISSQPRHLLNAPPAEEFIFDFEEWIPVAIAGLQRSTILAETRKSLVPNELDEESFWRNYFFRVTLLKRAFNVPEGPQLKQGAIVPSSNVLRSSLTSSTSSVGLREPSDLSASSSSAPPPSADEPHINGLLDSTDSPETDDSLPAVDLNQSLAALSEAPENDYYDTEDASAWHMHQDYGDGASVQAKAQVSDEILKALED